MREIITSIYTNADKHGDDVSKIVELGENAIAAIIADGVSTCTSGRIASSFLAYYIEEYLGKKFRQELGAEELEDMACSAIEYGAQELVEFNNSIHSATKLLQKFYKNSNDLKKEYENDLNKIFKQLNDLSVSLDEKNKEKIEDSKAHAKVKEILEDKRAWGYLKALFGQSESEKDIESLRKNENSNLENEIKELNNKIKKLQEDKINLERKIADVDHYQNGIAEISFKKGTLPNYLLDDDLYDQMSKEMEVVSNQLLSIIKETLNQDERQKEVYQKIQIELLNAINKGEKLLFKTNLCLAILVKRNRKEKSDYRLYTFVLGDPEVRVISIKNKDNKEVYLKSSSAALTSFISNDALSGIHGNIDYKCISIKEDDFIILASDGANIRYNKSSTFPYTYFINTIGNYDKDGKIADLAKLWYQQLAKENAISDDFSLISIKIE